MTINPLLKDSFNLEPLQTGVFEPGKPLRYDCHQVFFIQEGHGELRIDGEQYPWGAPSILLLSKGQVYTFDNGKATGYLLQFGDCFWQKAPASAADCKALLFDDPGGPRVLHTTMDDLNRILSIVIAALHEFRVPDYPNKSDVLAAYLKIIVIQLANIRSLLQQPTATFDGRLYQRFLTLVQEEVRKTHQVAAYAERLGVSTRKLTDCCSQFGTGAKEMIDRQLVAEAKRLLQFSTRSVKEVASALHFANPYQFSHYFKKHTHLSPTEYKQQFADIGI